MNWLIIKDQITFTAWSDFVYKDDTLTCYPQSKITQKPTNKGTNLNIYQSPTSGKPSNQITITHTILPLITGGLQLLADLQFCFHKTLTNSTTTALQWIDSLCWGNEAVKYKCNFINKNKMQWLNACFLNWLSKQDNVTMFLVNEVVG